jgi:cytochrome P450
MLIVSSWFINTFGMPLARKLSFPFRSPDRWLGDLPSATNSIPGLWANTMTFSGGPRSCIGYRFAIYGMKALLLCLVKSFYFELAVDPKDIMRSELYVYFLLIASR